jgi:hypothetical protein
MVLKTKPSEVIDRSYRLFLGAGKKLKLAKMVFFDKNSCRYVRRDSLL